MYGTRYRYGTCTSGQSSCESVILVALVGGGKGAWMRVQVRGFPYAFAYIFRFRGAQNHTVTSAKLRELSRPGM